MQTVQKVAAVCINWNGGSALGETLESLLHSDYPDLQILVVDNASSDNSLSGLPESIEILKLQANTGYGRAINSGISYLERKNRNAPVGFYMILNNDIQLEPDTVSTLVACAEAKGPGIYGPAVVQMNDPDRLEAAWGELTWSHVLTRLKGKNASVSSSPWNNPAENIFLLGSVMLIHNSIIKAGIRFDPLYFMYHEEVDFIYTAKQEGFPSYYCPSARARHSMGLGTRNIPLKKVYWTRRNSIYFLKKHNAGIPEWIKCLGTMFSSFLFTILCLRFRRARAIFSGFIDGTRGISENHPEDFINEPG